jgi:hypothetical protein
MNNKGFEHPIYKKYFSNLRNVRNVPQDKHDKTPERVNVHYPLAREIAEGKLTQYEGFESYIHKNVLVLCNLRINASQDEGKDIRPWKKKNPDIIALTSQGEISAFECKNDAKFPVNDIDRMAMTFITLIDIAGPYTLSNRTSKDTWSKWSFLYKTCYEKENRFPTLQDSLSELFSIRDFEKKKHWAQLVTESIKGSKFRYIIAFAGVPKRENIKELIRELKMRINEYDPSINDFVERISFLSLENGKIRNFSQARDYLD